MQPTGPTSSVSGTLEGVGEVAVPGSFLCHHDAQFIVTCLATVRLGFLGRNMCFAEEP